MRWKWVAGGVGVAVVAVLGLGFVASNLKPAKRPNVLILLWDTTRADRTSVYGYGIDTTPRMKAWADEHGVVFERAVSPDMWTVPSHASLFTGLPPSTHGANLDHRHLDGHRTTLAEWFGQQGWDTYAFSANPNLQRDKYQLLQGFETIDLSWDRKWLDQVADHTQAKLLKRDRSTEISPGTRKRKSKRSYAYNAATVAHEAFTRWLDLRDDAEKPFFAYLSYMEAHKPRVPSLEARRRVADDDTIKLGLDTDLSFKSQLLYSYDKKSYTPEELAAVNRVYDATLVELDDATADLLDDLEARGVLDDTIVVWTADHGEQLGEHQLFGHRSGVYQALLHVPLVVSYPRKVRAARVSVPVSNLEVYDTLLDLAGLPKPGSDFVRGNLLEAGKRAAAAVFSETLSIDRIGFSKVRKLHPDLGRDVWANMYRAVVDDRLKLVQTVSFDTHEVVHCELYDVVADPHETTDLYDQDPARALALAAKIGAWKETTASWDPERADVVSDAPTSDAERRQLEMLGYLEEEGGEDEGGEAVEPAPAPPPPGTFDDAELAKSCARLPPDRR